MYVPKHFEMKDQQEMFAHMQEHNFATVISTVNGEPFATHLPLMLDRENSVLHGHFARGNPQWKDIEGQKVLAIFQGPHTYISPSWYETNIAVPTWNYTTVHVYGEMEIIKDPGELKETLDVLVKKYEHDEFLNELHELDEAFIEGMYKGIVGFKINITKIEGKAKLSQNHPEPRKKQVIQQLQKQNDPNAKAIAAHMQHHLK